MQLLQCNHPQLHPAALAEDGGNFLFLPVPLPPFWCLADLEAAWFVDPAAGGLRVVCCWGWEAVLPPSHSPFHFPASSESCLLGAPLAAPMCLGALVLSLPLHGLGSLSLQTNLLNPHCLSFQLLQQALLNLSFPQNLAMKSSITQQVGHVAGLASLHHQLGAPSCIQ